MNIFLSTQNIPVVEVRDELFEQKGIKLFVKRDDLIHPFLSGNKWRKLRYNIEEMMRQKKNVILTFGGAYSNHILATAAAGKEFGFSTIGIIRGEEPEEKNHVLRQAIALGMKLHFISRAQYRMKHTEAFLINLKEGFEDFYLVPEGGANESGVRGCAEIISELKMDYTHICCCCGTGTTLAGIARSMPSGKKAIGICVHKGGASVLENLIQWTSGNDNFEVINDYHFGGYAKSNDELKRYSERFSAETGIPVEPVYTAKMFYGIYDLAKRNYFGRGSVLIALHTGGIHNQL
ncbi:MAG: 1-aminocyclopropane-1-carboxylate deaminase/D-cysteine desulfhydrase [Bacteroidia bacterium]|nr:1-aminocyclopropane-1-carboxylate deaminase/D-cysteine desulfhydrase [Bacteroidia bacterium]